MIAPTANAGVDLQVPAGSLAATAPGLADLLPPSQIAKRIHGRPHVKSILRWMTKGVLRADGMRVRLRSVRAGRQRLTCEAWVLAFFEAQSESVDATAAPATVAGSTPAAAAPATPARRRATASRLAAAGLRRKGRR